LKEFAWIGYESLKMIW